MPAAAVIRRVQALSGIIGRACRPADSDVLFSLPFSVPEYDAAFDFKRAWKNRLYFSVPNPVPRRAAVLRFFHPAALRHSRTVPGHALRAGAPDDTLRSSAVFCFVAAS